MAVVASCNCVAWHVGGQATEALRITAPELIELGVMDEVIPEPLGGAHADPMGCFPAIKEAIMRHYHQSVPHPPLVSLSPALTSLPTSVARRLASIRRASVSRPGSLGLRCALGLMRRC